VFPEAEEEHLPGDSSPKSDTTLKRSMSLNERPQDITMPYYSEDEITSSLEQQPSQHTTPAFPVSTSFDSSESEAVGSPERNITIAHDDKISEEDSKVSGEMVDDNTSGRDEQRKTNLSRASLTPTAGLKFQHYTRVPQLRRDVSMYVLCMFVHLYVCVCSEHVCGCSEHVCVYVLVCVYVHVCVYVQVCVFLHSHVHSLLNLQVERNSVLLANGRRFNFRITILQTTGISRDYSDVFVQFRYNTHLRT